MNVLVAVILKRTKKKKNAQQKLKKKTENENDGGEIVEKCPKCGEWKYQHNGFLGKFECYGCGRVETDREKEIRMAKAKGLVSIEEFNELQNLVKKLEKQIETLLKATKTKPKGKRG